MPGDKSTKSAKSSKKDKEKSEKDKKSKGGKSERTNKKSSKSARSSQAATPTREKSKPKTRDGAGSVSPSNIDGDAMSQLKSHMGDMDAAANTLPVFPEGGVNLGATAGSNAMGIPAESPFRTQPILNPHVTQSKTCMLHSKPLRYFCDSCEELLCYDCTVMGPHNTQLHRICNMEEAFRYRFETINKAIHNSLVPKRAQLIGQIVRLDHRLDEIKTVKNVIERDIRNEYAGIMERLRSAEGVKTAVLQHDIAEVQKDITRIDEILMFMEEIAVGGEKQAQVQAAAAQTQPAADGEQAAAAQAAATTPTGPNQFGFLNGYRQLNENMEYAVTKQFKVDIDVYPNDLPRELAERQVLLEHYEEQRKLLKFKDDVIWKLSQELKKKYDFYQEEFDKETRHEMNEWAQLVDRYAGELKKYELVCAFCGQHMSDSNINAECADNCHPRDQLDQEQLSVFFTEDEPEVNSYGNRRHYFGKPSQRNFKADQNQQFNTGIPMANSKADEFVLRNQGLVPQIKSVGEQLAIGQAKWDLEQAFKMNDGANSGMCSRDDFINAVFDTVRGLKPSALMKLLTVFADDYDNDMVNYFDFVRLVERQGQVGGLEYQNQQLTLGRQSQSALGGRYSERSQRDVIERVKQSLLQARGGLPAFQSAMKKLGGNGGVTISQDDLMLALSRVNASVNLDDIREFYRAVGGETQSQGASGEDQLVQVAEVVQLLSV